MIHIPLLRSGNPYKSLETYRLNNQLTGEAVCEVSLANKGLIAKDMHTLAELKHKFSEISIAESLQMCKSAANYFVNADLSIAEHVQQPQDYVRQLSSTTGFPHSLCKQNMKKIQSALEQMETILTGMTRSSDLSFLDNPDKNQNIHFICETDSLGVVLPNNSPGVHSLWLPTIPLKVGLCLKPGSREPWTPYRIIQAFIKAGFPKEVFGFYPADYTGSMEVMLRSGRSMIFGDQSSVEQWRHDPRVQIHGPGWSKIIFGSDVIDDWEKYLDFIETSVAANSGRSCINVSSIWVPAHGREIAQALAKRLLKIQALALDHPEAKLAAFSEKNVAQRISSLIDNHLISQEAIDISQKLRNEHRLVEKEGWTFLQPTVLFTDNPLHPLANSEFLFPFVTVVESSQQKILDYIGQTLVASVVTSDQRFIRNLLNYREIDRLNIGPIPTNQILYDQPHEGNLFEHLYRQRALQMVS